MSTITYTSIDRSKEPKPFNWIPANAVYTGADGVPHVVAQMNGDGTLFVDWPKFELFFEKFEARVEPDSDPGALWLHALMAMHQSRLADAPRDFQWAPAATEKAGQV